MLLVSPFPLQHQVEGVGELAREAEAAAVVHILARREAHVERHRVASVGLALVLVVMAQLQRVAQGQRVGGPG